MAALSKSKKAQSSAFFDEAAISAVDRVESSIQRIKEVDPKVRAFVDFDEDGARASTARIDGISQESRGSLHGIPVAIKEIFDVAGLRCCWGSKIHQDRVPDSDCSVVKTLKRAGAVVLGTVASTEYAIADTSQTRNPWNLNRTPGASSSGSAASVATGMAPLAIGSQTIGSTIRPAGYCGVIGFKPTRALISLDGVMTLSSELDHVGIFANSIDLLSTAFDVLQTSSEKRVEQDDDAPKILVLAPWGNATFSEASKAAVTRSADRLKSCGFSVQSFSLPNAYDDEYDCLMDILCHDMARSHQADFFKFGELMDAKVRDQIERGLKISALDFASRKRRAAEIGEQLNDILSGQDIFLTPSTEGVAPLAAKGTGDRTVQRIWTLAGMPAISVPADFSEGLPIGVQLIGAKNTDRKLLATAAMLIENTSKGNLSHQLDL